MGWPLCCSCYSSRMLPGGSLGTPGAGAPELMRRTALDTRCGAARLVALEKQLARRWGTARAVLVAPHPAPCWTAQQTQRREKALRLVSAPLPMRSVTAQLRPLWARPVCSIALVYP